MSGARFSLYAAVYLLLQREGKILLLRRFNTGWQDGMYTLPAGHVDGKESIVSTMAREAQEETGIVIEPSDLEVIHTVHQVGDREYIDFYLKTAKWIGEPTNTEPNKCDDMQWFLEDQLPENLLPNVRHVLRQLNDKQTFSEFRWK
jgi:8-oxo-dGTP diphosphatase